MENADCGGILLESKRFLKSQSPHRSSSVCVSVRVSINLSFVFKITSVSPVSLLSYSQCLLLGFRGSGSSQVMKAARFFPALAPAVFIMPGWKPHFAFCGGDQPPLQQKPPSKMNKRELAECLECSVDLLRSMEKWTWWRCCARSVCARTRLLWHHNQFQEI